MEIKLRVAALIRYNNKLLMVKHNKAGISYWLLPGGGIKAGEGARDALKRECREELNLEIDVDSMVFVVESISKGKSQIIQIVFACRGYNYNSISVGIDRRVVDFDFLTSETLERITIYPDIKNEIINYLKYQKPCNNYIYRDWLN